MQLGKSKIEEEWMYNTKNVFLTSSALSCLMCAKARKYFVVGHKDQQTASVNLLSRSVIRLYLF